MTTLLTKEITREEAEQRTADHKLAIKDLEHGWTRFCLDIEESVRLGVPAKLGMTMRAWLADTSGKSASHIFRQLQSFRSLKGVPEETLAAIPEANAHELVKLTEKDRRDPQIVSKAVSQKPKEFKETVKEIRAQKYGITPDRWETFAVRLPKEVFDAIMAAEGKSAAVLEIDLSDEEHRPARRVTVWEAIAARINLTPDAQLKSELEGL